MTLNKVDREAVPDMPNRLGIAGIEFIEYATSRPQALQTAGIGNCQSRTQQVAHESPEGILLVGVIFLRS